MKARELKPGMEIGLWTVVSVFEVCGIVEHRTEAFESKGWSSGATVSRMPDPWNTLIFVELERGIPDPAMPWRTWYRADEDVEA